MMKILRSTLKSLLVCCLALTAGAQVNTAQQLAFAGLRTAAMQGQINGIQTDPAGNLYLLLDQKDGVRLLKSDHNGSTVLAQAILGAKGDIGVALALDPAGNVYITGTTTSSTFAATSGAAITTRTDASTQSFVAKFDSSLNPLFVTYTGGSKIAATALSATADAVFVTGLTYAANLPVTANGIQQSPATGSSQNGFVEKFSATGSTLLYATYLTGANGDTTPAAIVADATDNAYIAGETTATGYPTVAALVPNILSNPSGFLSKLTPAGDALTFSTFIPGTGLTSLALDSTGQALLASGSVALGQFPVDTVAMPLVPTPYQVLLRLPLDGSTVTSGVLLAPGTQSFVAAAPSGAAWVDGNLSIPLLPLTPLADAGTGFALRVTSSNTIDQTARFGGLPTTNAVYANLPATITSVAVDPAGEPLIAGSVQPTASSSLLATETYDLPLRNAPTPALPSALKDAEVTAATCSGSLCAGSAAYLSKLTPVSAPALSLSANDLPFVTVRNLGTTEADNLQLTTTAGTTTSSCGTTLPAGGECVLLLTGGAAGTLTVSATNTTPQQLAFAAYTAPASAVIFSPKELDFGITTGTSAAQTRTLTVTNLGSTSQAFTSANLTTQASPFAESSSDCTTAGAVANKVLAAGGTCHITISFTPPTPDGIQSGYWTLGARSVLLTGYSQAASLSLSATELDFGTQFAGGIRLPRYLYISNNSAAPASHAALSLPSGSPFSLTDACPAILLARSVCRIRVDYLSTVVPSSDSASLTLDGGTVVTLTGTTHPQPGTGGQTANPNLSVTPTTIVFANSVAVTSVSSTTQTVAITNSGATAFTVTLALTGDFTQTNSCPTSLPGGQTCAVVLTFVPSQVGTRQGLLAVTAGSGTTPVYVTLSGTATAILPASNNSLPFGSVPVGQPLVQFYKIAQPFTALTATATGPYTVAEVEDTGNGPGSPSATAYAATVTAACHNCYLAVRFLPSAAGAQPGTLTLSSVAAGSPYVLTLTGSGLATAGLVLSPAAQDFGLISVHSSSGAIVFTLTNLSTAGSAVQVSGPAFTGDFQQVAATTGAPACAGTLAYGASCEFAVAFVPTATGTRTGTVTLTGGGLTATATLTGTGAANPGVALNPASLTFNNVPGATSTVQTITVTNTGSSALTVGAPAASTTAFAATSACTTLAPATSCTVTVTFTPGTSITTDTLSLTITTAAGTAAYTVPLAGAFTAATAGLQIVPTQSLFGPKADGSQGVTRLLTVNNLTAKAAALTVSIPRQYVLSGAPCTQIAANGSCTFGLTFLPLTNGDIPGTLTAQADPIDGSAMLNGIGYVEGYGTGQGVLTISGGAIVNGAYSFGQVTSGQTFTQPFTLANLNATANITIRRITSAPPFLVSPTCATTLAPGQNCTVYVVYAPSNQVAIGTASPASTADTGALIIESDAASSPDTLVLTGLAGPVAVASPANIHPITPFSLSQGSLTFGATALGNVSAAQTITLTNTGSVTLHLEGLVTTADFSATGACLNVAVGGTCTLSVTSNPQTLGTHIASLEILSDGSTAVEFVSLISTGTPSTLSLNPVALNFGSLLVGNSATLTVQVANTSNAPIAFAAITTTGDYTASSTCPAPGATLAAGATCTIQVVFTPIAAGTRTGQLSVATSASTLPLTVSLTGNGVLSQLSITPATLAFGTVTIGSPANLSLTLTNTGTNAITNLALAATGDYAVTLPCPSTTLVAGGSCVLQLTFTPTAAGTRPGTLTIASSDPGSPRTITLTGTGALSGSFALTVNGGLIANASVQSGNPATYPLTLSPTGGFTGPVALTCSPVNPAQYANCSLSPSTLTLAGSALTATATINTITSSASELSAESGTNLRPLLAVLFAAGLLGLRRPRRPVLWLAILGVLAAAAGCGGSGSKSTPVLYTPAGTYQYTVTASSTSGAAITQTVILNLTVTSR